MKTDLKILLDVVQVRNDLTIIQVKMRRANWEVIEYIDAKNLGTALDGVKPTIIDAAAGVYDVGEDFDEKTVDESKSELAAIAEFTDRKKTRNFQLAEADRALSVAKNTTADGERSIQLIDACDFLRAAVASLNAEVGSAQ